MEVSRQIGVGKNEGINANSTFGRSKIDPPIGVASTLSWVRVLPSSGSSKGEDSVTAILTGTKHWCLSAARHELKFVESVASSAS